MSDLTKPIDISDVNQAYTKYKDALNSLDVLSAQDVLKFMSAELGVQNSVVLRTIEKGGISKKYDGTFTGDKKIGTMVERTLTVGTVVAEMADEPERYRKSWITDVAGNMWEKKHPFELWLLQYGINIASDELHDAIFMAKLQAGTGILDSFDGINEIIDADITATLISAAKENYYATGAMTAADCGDKLLAMWRSAPSTLRGKGANMIIGEDLGDMYDDWYKAEHDAPPKVETAGQLFLDNSNKKCRLIRTSAQPENSQRVIITSKKNLKFGVDKLTDMKAMKAFNSGNPYLFTATMKYVFGTQFESIHKSRFIVNDQPATPVA
ncbi:MAG: hypothetical protein K8S00_12080 [Bacteroidales bacterium]|nr:hypothetical protein [Bacteroidales bacterium]